MLSEKDKRKRGMVIMRYCKEKGPAFLQLVAVIKKKRGQFVSTKNACRTDKLVKINYLS